MLEVLTGNRIIDASGNEIIKDGVQGEVMLRGPSMMTQYLGNMEATVEAFAHGWLMTGDIAYYRTGKWYLVGRSKVRWHPSPTEIREG